MSVSGCVHGTTHDFTSHRLTGYSLLGSVLAGRSFRTIAASSGHRRSQAALMYGLRSMYVHTQIAEAPLGLRCRGCAQHQGTRIGRKTHSEQVGSNNSYVVCNSTGLRSASLLAILNMNRVALLTLCAKIDAGSRQEQHDST